MRPIDADELITAFPCGETVRTECVRATIEHMPTIEERKTGKWIIHKGACEPDYMECSRCKWITEYYDGIEKAWSFCPHCGCDMRQEGEDRE